jgi:isopenicillin N synthase-like dioxygenase
MPASVQNRPKYDKVPTLSLRQYIDGDAFARTTFIEDLFAGFKYYGFVILKDHPVSVDLLNKAYEQVESLFELPEATKQSYISKVGGNQRGYTPFGKEHAKNSPVHDLKEFWHVGRALPAGHKYQTEYPENIWPKELPDFQSTMNQLYTELDEVGRIMLEALTFPLELELDYFDKMIKDGNSILRLLHYPPLKSDVDPRCVRAAAHEDINLITILVAATTSGLELLDREGRWLPVETDKNNLIVDAGDMLARLTNDVIPSTTHRVVNPNDGTNSRRYSMPYFIHPNPEAYLTCIESCKGEGEKYPSIRAQDFLVQRLVEIGLLKPSEPTKPADL